MTAPAGDVLDRTAQQVRVPVGNDTERAVHRMTKNTVVKGTGHLYDTGCDRVLSAVEGAILTTRDVTCGACLSGGRR